MPYFTKVLNQILFKPRRIRLYYIWECYSTVLILIQQKNFCFLFHFNNLLSHKHTIHVLVLLYLTHCVSLIIFNCHRTLNSFKQLLLAY